MTAVPNNSPAGPPADHQEPVTLFLSTLLKRAAVDAMGESLGRLADVIVELRGNDYPLVTGLVADVGGRQVFIPAEAVVAWQTDRLELSSAQVDLRRFEQRDGEVLLRANILGHRLIDVEAARLVRAYDARLVQQPAGWVVTGLDVHRAGWLRLRRHDQHDFRDWKVFEALIGHQPSVLVRAPFGRLRRLKPAQIADLLEEASPSEQSEILSHVHDDPELEADVFEELEDERQSRLLATRGDAEIAGVLARMHADDAADALMELPQERRQPVLDLLPPAQQTKVTALLGYSNATAGGLMGVEFVALASDATVADALAAVRAATTMQPEALTAVYMRDGEGRLRGVVGLVRLLQTEPVTPLRAVVDADPVRVRPAADLIEVTMAMADYNLITLPVIDDDERLVGLIVVDDVLEASIPDNWRHREPAARPRPAPAR